MAESSFVEQNKVRLQEGDIVYKKGDMAEQMYVVMAGKVRLYLADNASGSWSEELVKGDFFGEGSLLEALPRETTAVAMEDSELMSISRGTFTRMIRQNPEISVKMMQRLTQRNRELTGRVEADGQKSTNQEQPKAPVQVKPMACFVSVSSGKKYNIETNTALLGRFDPATGIYPDIDLSGDEGHLSVSRRHANIIFELGRYFVVEEKGVANGTFVHGGRLVPGDVHEIFHDDRISFGTVVLSFQVENG
ncbi:MAG: cyclic nucleotide-binding domain-containing protein [Holophagaceae bacterium]|nr:cyclic nucleotide-binding domain-containing protein [Holophagaceae bacterium]